MSRSNNGQKKRERDRLALPHCDLLSLLSKKVFSYAKLKQVQSAKR